LGFSVRKRPSLAWGQLRLLVFAKRDVSVVLKRQKVARVGGLVVNRDLGTGVMGNKGGLVSTFVVEKEGFATTCTAINAHLRGAGVHLGAIAPVRAARIVDESRNAAAGEGYAPMAWRWTYKVLPMASRDTQHTETRQKKTQARPRGQVPRAHGRPGRDPEES